MIVTVLAYKGGVGKTTTAVHLAGAFGYARLPTLLVDSDRIPSAFRWYSKQGDWPFEAALAQDAGRDALNRYRNEGAVVIDTPAAPSADDLVTFGQNSDLVIVPTTPDALAIHAIADTVKQLRDAEVEHRVLLTMVPPPPQKAGEQTRSAMEDAGLPLFEAEVPAAAAFRRAALNGTLVGNVRDRRAALMDWIYDEVAKEVLELVGRNE